MKKNYIFIAFWLFVSCTPQYYSYQYKMINTTTLNEMAWRDSIIEASFVPGKNSIGLKVANITNNVLQVDWNGTAIVRDGRAFMASSSMRQQPSATLPAQSFLQENVFILDDTYYSAGIAYKNYYSPGKYVVEDLFNTMVDRFDKGRSAQKNVGKRLRLILPISAGNQQYFYDFEFEVVGVSKKTIPFGYYKK